MTIANTNENQNDFCQYLLQSNILAFNEFQEVHRKYLIENFYTANLRTRCKNSLR
jgi:hypothetical protein